QDISNSLQSTVMDTASFNMMLQFGWILGAFITFIALGRKTRVALLTPLVVSTIAAALFLLDQQRIASPLFLLFVVTTSVVQSLFLSAAVVFLSVGKANRLDFDSPLVIIFAAMPASMMIAPWMQSL